MFKITKKILEIKKITNFDYPVSRQKQYQEVVTFFKINSQNVI